MPCGYPVESREDGFEVKGIQVMVGDDNMPESALGQRRAEIFHQMAQCPALQREGSREIGGNVRAAQGDGRSQNRPKAGAPIRDHLGRPLSNVPGAKDIGPQGEMGAVLDQGSHREDHSWVLPDDPLHFGPGKMGEAP